MKTITRTSSLPSVSEIDLLEKLKLSTLLVLLFLAALTSYGNSIDPSSLAATYETTTTIERNASSECTSCSAYSVENTTQCSNQQREYVLFLEGSKRNGAKYFRNLNLKWEILDADSARLSGNVIDNNNTKFRLDVTFTGRSDENKNPKLHLCTPGSTDGWYYYTDFVGTIKKANGRWSTTISRRGPAFQIGNGANETEAEKDRMGASGWFNTTNKNYKVGDININLGHCKAPIEVGVEAGDDVKVCAGDATVLTAVADAGTYEWSTGETSASITVTPSETTTYKVTNTIGDCVAVDYVKVTVIPAPVVDLGEDQTVINPTTVTLDATVTTTDIVPGISYEISNTTACFEQGLEYVAWLQGIDATIYLMNVNAEWTVLEDGTATLKGALADSETGNLFNVDALFSGLTQQTPSDSPKPPKCSTGALDTSSWSYYTELSGNITSEDGSINATLTRRGPAFQLGNGANDSDIVYDGIGGAGWFYSSDANFTIGDFNINVGSVITPMDMTTTYEWSTGETTSTIDVTPTTTTTYTVTVTSGGCSTTDSITITVITCETTVDAGDDQKICEGDEATLTATAAIGSYEWSTGETTETITVAPTETTTYQVTNTTEEGCVSIDYVQVIVTPAPVVDLGGDQTQCTGSTVTLDATVTTGTAAASVSYEVSNTTACFEQGLAYVAWLRGVDATIYLSNENATWTVFDDGTAKLSGALIDNATGELYAVDALFSGLTQQAPADSPKASKCAAAAPDSSSWNFYTKLSGSITSADGTFVANLNRRGPAFQLGIGANDADADRSGVSGAGWFYSDNREYTIGDFNINIGKIITPMEMTTTYEWSTGETTSSIDVNPNETTTYTVTVTTGGCTTTESVTIAIDTFCGSVGIESIGNIKTFPVPANTTQSVHVVLTSAVSQNLELEVYDVNGNAVMKMKEQHIEKGSNTISLATEQLASGIYFVKVKTENGKEELKKFLMH